MKKGLIIIAIAAAFGFGFTLNSILTKKQSKMKKVTGIGGIFLNAKTLKQLTNGIKHTWGLTLPHMEQVLNGGRMMTAQKRD
jgi:hypothetical protein